MSVSAVKLISDVGDPEKDGLYAGFYSERATPGTLFIEGDINRVEYYPVKRADGSPVLTFLPADVLAENLYLAVGDPSPVPSSGTGILAYNGNAAGLTVAPTTTEADLQAAINANPAVVAVGGANAVTVKRIKNGTYRVLWNTNGARSLFTGDPSGFTPESNIFVYETQVGNAGQPSVQMIKFVQRPYVYATGFTPIGAAVASVTTIQAGTETKKALFRVSISPLPYAGSFTVKGSGPLGYRGSETDWQTAVGSDWSLLKTGDAEITIERTTVGEYSLAPGDIDVTGLSVYTGFAATLNFNGSTLFEKFASISENSFQTWLHIRSIDGTNKETLTLVRVTITREILSSESIAPSNFNAGFYTKAESDARFVHVEDFGFRNSYPEIPAVNQMAAADHLIQYQDSTVWNEQWADLSQWGASGVSVSGGNLYGSNANPAGAQRSFVVPTGANARVFGSFNTGPATPGNIAYITLGLSSNTAGAVPPAGAGNMFLLGAQRDGSGNFALMDLNTSGISTFSRDTDPAIAANTTYYISISIDPVRIVFCLTDAAHTIEWKVVVLRSAFGDIKNVGIWLGDPLGTSGASIGAIGARLETPTIAPRTRVEGIADFVTQTVDSSGQRLRLWMPRAYDSRKPSPLIIFCHGSGWSETFPWTGQSSGMPERPFFKAIIDAGYMMISSEMHGNNWGNDNSLSDITRALSWVRDRYAISHVFVMGASMGGVPSLLYIAGGEVKISGYVGLYPVTNLRNLYEVGYGSEIRTAYGIAGDGSDYDEKTEGHDPQLIEVGRYYGVPMRFYVSSADTIVPTPENAEMFADKLSVLNGDIDLVYKSGEHGDASQYDSADVIAFLNKCQGK